jgi:GNAT superfamily N-acetyltransferase
VNVVAVSGENGEIADAQLLAAAERVHLQLRPHLAGRYVPRMREVIAAGAEMAVAHVDGEVLGVAVYRMVERTFSGREMYCDDLVTDEARRSKGVGHALMEHMRSLCARRGADAFTLDSGVQREQAHKFYFREGMTVTSFHFTQVLSDRPTGLKRK